MNKKINVMSEENMLKDVVLSIRYLTNMYSQNLDETSNRQLSDIMLKMSREEHNVANMLLDELQKRGWFFSKTAEQQDIEQIRNKYDIIKKTL